MKVGYDETQPGDRRYEDLIARGSDDPPHNYRWRSSGQQAFGVEATETVIETATRWAQQAEGQRLGDNAHGPTPTSASCRASERLTGRYGCLDAPNHDRQGEAP